MVYPFTISLIVIHSDPMRIHWLDRWHYIIFSTIYCKKPKLTIYFIKWLSEYNSIFSLWPILVYAYWSIIFLHDTKSKWHSVRNTIAIDKPLVAQQSNKFSCSSFCVSTVTFGLVNKPLLKKWVYHCLRCHDQKVLYFTKFNQDLHLASPTEMDCIHESRRSPGLSPGLRCQTRCNIAWLATSLTYYVLKEFEPKS